MEIEYVALGGCIWPQKDINMTSSIQCPNSAHPWAMTDSFLAPPMRLCVHEVRQIQGHTSSHTLSVAAQHSRLFAATYCCARKVITPVETGASYCLALECGGRGELARHRGEERASGAGERGRRHRTPSRFQRVLTIRSMSIPSQHINHLKLTEDRHHVTVASGTEHLF